MEHGCLWPVTVNRHQPFHVFLTQTIHLDTSQILPVPFKHWSYCESVQLPLQGNVKRILLLFADLTAHYVNSLENQLKNNHYNMNSHTMQMMKKNWTKN